MKAVNIDKDLLTSDGCKIIIGKDRKENFIFYGVDKIKFVGVKISEKDLELIENGDKDISGLFTHPKSKLLYPCTIKGGKIQLHFLSTKDLIKEYLCPNKGLFVEKE